MNIDKHKFCMEVLNRGKVATQSQSKFDCLVKKEEHDQTINTEHCKNEFCINFRRNVWWTSEKEQLEHSGYEFQTVILSFHT